MNTRLFLLLAICLFSAAPTQPLLANQPTFNVLLIQSYTNRTQWHEQIIAGVNDGLSQEGINAKVTTEYLDADFWPFASERLIMRRICQRARQQQTHLIITDSDEALFTLMNCGDSLAYQLPLVISGVKYPNIETLAKLPNLCGYTTQTNFDAILQTARQIFPKRTEIICLTDNSILSRKSLAQMNQSWNSFKTIHPEYTFKTYNVQTTTTTEVVSSICYTHNAYNRIVIAPCWTPFLSFIGKNSKAPFFASESIALTNGVFGVHDSDTYTAALAAGKRAAQVLKGTNPATLGITNLPSNFIFDYKQLEFFHINERQVKNIGTIINIPLSDHYRWPILLLYTIIVLSLVGIVIWLYRTNRREYRKRMQAQTRLLIQNRLVEQRDEFDNIFYSIRDGLITYDTDFRIHFLNHALMMMLNLDHTTHSGRKFEGQTAGTIFRIYLDGQNILHTLLKQVIETKTPISIPEKAFMQEIQTGTYFPVSGEIVPILAKGKMTGMAMCCRNVSEEEMQKRFFNLAVEESSIYVWQYNMRTQSFYFPEGWLQKIGLPKDYSMTSRGDFDKLIHPHDLTTTHQYFDAILQGHKLNSRINFRLQNTQDHHEWWEFRSTAFDGLTPDAPYMVLGVCQSIQRYKDTEEALIIARDRAMQADMLKSAFLANMSHEIRTPLNAIVGFSDLLQNVEAFTPEEVTQFVETINTNCTLLLALINDILDLSRIESGTMDFQFAPYDLTFVMQQIYDSQRLNMPKGVELVIDVPQDADKTIITDSVRLKQVVNNFINNAKKFTTEGSIMFGYLTEEPGYTVFFVEDTGSGISEENLRRIFERFYKVDSFTQGAGLGLSICQTIVDRFRGKISVTSELGKGTRFMVRVPNENV